MQYSEKTHVFNLQLGDRELPFETFETSGDIQTCNEVLSGQAYPLVPWLPQVNTIVDIGANVGASSVFFRLHYPMARVWAFEPNPVSFALLTRNASLIGGITPLNIGLSDRTETVDFRLGGVSVTASHLPFHYLTPGPSVRVELRDAAQALWELKLASIDIVKIDTEGNEWPILCRIRPWLPRIGVIYLEAHSEDDRQKIDRLLGPTHDLIYAKILPTMPPELCYVHRAVVPDDRFLTAVEYDIAVRRRGRSGPDDSGPEAAS